MIRRKSDAVRSATDCAYHRSFLHETNNQRIHDARTDNDPTHDDRSPCWCCCPSCTDLSWYYEERQPSAPTPSGEPASTPERSAGSPGSAETSASW